MPVDKEKEKARKRKWYLDNREKLKAKREAKKKGEPFVITTAEATVKSLPKKPKKNIDKIKISKLCFFGTVVFAASALLVYFSVEVLGFHTIGWTTSILLEIGIVFLAIATPSNQYEFWFLKVCFVLFVVLSFFILKTGNETKRLEFISKDKVLTTKMEAIKRLNESHDNLPDNRITDRQTLLENVAKLSLQLNPTVEGLANLGTNTNLATRCMLLILNLIFSHAFIRTLMENST